MPFLLSQMCLQQYHHKTKIVEPVTGKLNHVAIILIVEVYIYSYNYNRWSEEEGENPKGAVRHGHSWPNRFVERVHMNC